LLCIYILKYGGGGMVDVMINNVEVMVY